MLIVAERINSSRKTISEAIEARDADFIRKEASTQAEAGASYIDVNAGSFVGQEAEYLCWLVDTVQEATELPLCIDSPDPAAVAAALERVKGRAMINSISLEKARIEGMLPLVKKYGAKIVALCQSDKGMANTADDKARIAGEMVKILTGEGIAPDDIYIDPLVYPIATDSQSAVASIEAVGRISREIAGVHTIGGLTNVSFGLPARKLINKTFLVTAMAHGLDSAIIDPTDRGLMANLIAAEALLDRDKFCSGYIKAYREGKLS